ATRYCLPPVWMTAYMRDASSECSRNRERIADGLFQHGLVDDEAAAVAVRAGRRERLDQALRHALSGHLDEPELRDREDLGAGLVAGEGLAEGFLHGFAVVADLHVDEVD